MDLPSITVSKETICLPSEAATRAFVQLKAGGTLGNIRQKPVNIKYSTQMLNIYINPTVKNRKGRF